MIYQATINPKCSIYSDYTMMYAYNGETTSEYHQIHSITKYVVLEEEENSKVYIRPRAYIGRYITAHRN